MELYRCLFLLSTRNRTDCLGQYTPALKLMIALENVPPQYIVIRKFRAEVLLTAKERIERLKFSVLYL